LLEPPPGANDVVVGLGVLMGLTAAELLQRFAIYGRFYRTMFDGKPFELRSHLEIVETGIPWPQAADADADLVAVMMNPGGSRPTATLDAHGWAPAVPDRTQYQLMKLALHAQSQGAPIRHIRVINLSDLRTPKSAALFATLDVLTCDRHSLFSAGRLTELERALGASHVPILRAWGLATQLKDLAKLGVARTASRTVLGLTDDGLKYRHPLPQRADLQRVWLEQVCAQVDALARARSMARPSKAAH
jgi:hypothetical protein